MVDVNSVVEKCVNDIWDEYDVDGSGALDRDECLRFIQQTMKEFGGDQAVQNFSYEDFDVVFRDFDRD